MATQVELPLTGLGNFSPGYSGPDHANNLSPYIDSTTQGPNSPLSSPLSGRLEPTRRSTPKVGLQVPVGSQSESGSSMTLNSPGESPGGSKVLPINPRSLPEQVSSIGITNPGLTSPEYPQTPSKHIPTPRRSTVTRLPPSVSPSKQSTNLDSPPLGSILQTSPDRTTTRINGQPVDLTRLSGPVGSIPSLSIRPSPERSIRSQRAGPVLMSSGIPSQTYSPALSSSTKSSVRSNTPLSNSSSRIPSQVRLNQQPIQTGSNYPSPVGMKVDPIFDFIASLPDDPNQPTMPGSRMEPETINRSTMPGPALGTMPGPALGTMPGPALGTMPGPALGMNGYPNYVPGYYQPYLPGQGYFPPGPGYFPTNQPYLPGQPSVSASQPSNPGLNPGLNLAPDSSRPTEFNPMTSPSMNVPLTGNPNGPSSSPEVILTPEQIQALKVAEAKTRADYRVKYGILREAYPQMNIPEPEEGKAIPEIEAEYREYIKRILIDSSVEQNKTYLLIMWLIIELAGSRLMRLPFQGYTFNQFKYMNKYQMLLIELGESAAASGTGSGWPVEVRIMALALFNGVIFVMVKMLADKIGAGNGSTADEFTEVIANFLTQNRGQDVLRRAEQANSDNPPPPPVNNATPPMGGLGGMIAQLIGSLGSGGSGGLGGLGGLASMVGAAAGANNSAATGPAPEPPRVKRPTFASRRRQQPGTT